MKIFGWQIAREDKAAQFETTLQRLIAASEGRLEAVTPENCEQSPTVKAIVQAVSRRMSVTPVHVYRKATRNGGEKRRRCCRTTR